MRFMIVENEVEPRGRMDYPELSHYFTELVGDRIDRVAADSEVSRTTIYSIRKGQRARPENYQRLALAIGKTRVEQRGIYKQLMRLSGYLDLLPDGDEGIDTTLDTAVLEEIKARFPDIYRAAEQIIEARRRGDLPEASRVRGG